MKTNAVAGVKKRIFLLSPGPQYNIEHSFKSRCEALSQNFTGVVLTSGPEKSTYNFGNFKVICIKDPYQKSLISTIGFVLISFWLMLKSSVKRNPFNLFITYDPLKTGLIGALVTAFFKTRLVVEVNGDYTQDVIYDEIKNPIKRKFKQRSMLFVERFVLRRSAGIKLLYDTQVDYFKPLPNNPVIQRFPDYVNTDQFLNLGEQKELLLVGFPLKIKGVDILIEAFKQVADEYPEWTLKIMGYYPDLTELNYLINGHPNIRHQPPVDHSEIGKHIGKCGIFVLPSRTEAMGRVLIEAMAAGKPRVGSNVGGIPTVIDDNKDGLLFRTEDKDDLSKKLKQLMGDQALRLKLGAAARTRFEQDFTTDQYFKRLTQFYIEVDNS